MVSTMASIVGARILFPKLKNVKASSLPLMFVRTYWNKDFMPGPYPKTPEERAAAAKKYGMLPEDYEPYPDDGQGYGDYPKLPVVSAESRDPYAHWDQPILKRNFGEPLHADCDIYTEDRYNASARNRIPIWKQYLIFGTVFFGGFGLFVYCEEHKLTYPLMPKQYPGTGKHYTFEPNQ